MELPEARRCVSACAEYLRERGASTGSADLIRAVQVIEEHARLAPPPPALAGRRAGKQFASYQRFIDSVRRGERAAVFGREYVVLSKNKYDELAGKTGAAN